MNPFGYRKGKLFCEDLSVAQLAEREGTPLYLYSQSAFESQFRSFDQAFAAWPHLTCYAVKANSNIAVLSLFRKLGAGFDVVSMGEMNRTLVAGADPKTLIFSGVGKTEAEIDCGLIRGILQFNVESGAELLQIEARARTLGKKAAVALRVNPGIDAGTHPYIATGLQEHKFGIPVEDAMALYRRAHRSRHLTVSGIACHIGSQITSITPIREAARRMRDLFLDLRARKIPVQYLDLGGGLGIVYNRENPPSANEYGKAVTSELRGLDCTLVLEPGRAIVGSAGILVTRVVRTKQTGRKHFVVVDAGMSDLIRPSLYGSYHEIREVALKHRGLRKADVVGPICESGDFLARDRRLPSVKTGELLAVMSAGAYGFVLSSNYNARPRPAEVLIRKDKCKVIRKRESFQDLMRGEALRPL